jgi:hypothetical protein
MPKQGMDVTEQSRHGIGLDGRRLIGWRKASQIGRRHHVVAAEFRKLALIERPGVLGAVQEQHQFALAGTDKIQLHAVALGIALRQTGLASGLTRPDRQRCKGRQRQPRTSREQMSSVK